MIIIPIFFVCISYCTFADDFTAAIFNSDEWVKIDENLHNNPTPWPRMYPNQNSTATIFVAITSFRDNRCPVTIHNLFSKAAHPERVSIGLVEQIHTEHDVSNCIEAYCSLVQGLCPHKSKINRVTLSFLDARGPAFSRSLQSQLIQNEEFCMQVDSHSDVVEGWDVELVSMWQATSNEYAVLSTVPPDLPSLGKNVRGQYEVPHICEATFNHMGIVRHLAPRAAMNLNSPILAPHWSAAFSFAKCHAETKTPYDPHYLYIFDGEEFSKYARLWTRGYDVYTPHRIVVAHDYSGAMKIGAPHTASDTANPNEWVHNGMKDTYRWQMFEQSVRRIKTLLGSDGGDKDASNVAMLTRHGLGLKRTLDQFIEFTGVDTRKQVVFGDRCKQLHWVPFTPDRNPNIDSTDLWGDRAEEVKSNGATVPLLGGAIQYATYEMIQQPLDGSIDISEQQDYKEDLDMGVGGFQSSDIKASLNVAKGELWWIFQSVDSAVESVIVQVDKEVGSGQGHRVLKLILLLAPLLAFIFWGAIVALTGGRHAIRSDAKRI